MSRAAVQQLPPGKLKTPLSRRVFPLDFWKRAPADWREAQGAPCYGRTFPFVTAKPNRFPIPEMSSDSGTQREVLLPGVQVHKPTEPVVNTCWPVSFSFHKDRK